MNSTSESCTTGFTLPRIRAKYSSHESVRGCCSLSSMSKVAAKGPEEDNPFDKSPENSDGIEDPLRVGSSASNAGPTSAGNALPRAGTLHSKMDFTNNFIFGVYFLTREQKSCALDLICPR